MAQSLPTPGFCISSSCYSPWDHRGLQRIRRARTIADSSRLAFVPTDEQLLLRLERVLDWNCENRHLNLHNHAAWQVMHGVLPYQQRFLIETERVLSRGSACSRASPKACGKCSPAANEMDVNMHQVRTLSVLVFCVLLAGIQRADEVVEKPAAQAATLTSRDEERSTPDRDQESPPPTEAKSPSQDLSPEAQMLRAPDPALPGVLPPASH